MTDDFRPDVGAFLAAFFAPPNRLGRDTDPRVGPWVDRLRGPAPAATVLPCWRDGVTVDWYGVAPDDRELRSLAEDLTAFIGPSFSTFRGQRADLDPADPVDAAVAAFAGPRTFKFRGDQDRPRPAEPVWTRLERMRAVWARQPRRGTVGPPAAARLLRDFFMAAQAGNETSAEARLAELAAWNLLDATNLLFLRVRLYAALGRWARLLADPQFPDLLRMRRPLAVTEAMAEAVYQEYLRRPEERGDLDQVSRQFREAVLPLYGPLYAVRGGSRSAGLLRGLVLRASAADPPGFDLIDDVLAEPGLSEAERAALRRLAALAPPRPAVTVPVRSPLEDAAALALRGEYDNALTRLRDLPPTRERARLSCECAYELGTLDARAQAVAAVHGLINADRAAFLVGRTNRQLWDALNVRNDPTAPAGPDLPTDWEGILDLLAHPGQQRRAVRLAEQAAAEWSPEGLAADAADRLAGKLLNLPPDADPPARDCLPHLLAFFRKDSGWPRREFRVAYRAVLDLLWASTPGGEDDLALFLDLIEAHLRLGVGPEEYAELLGQGLDLWHKYRSPALLDWMLNFLAVLTDYPCPDPARRAEVLDGAVGGYLQFARRAGPEQREALLGLAELQGDGSRVAPLLPAPPVAAAGDPMRALRELSVAIYTLTESAGRLAGQVLERGYPGVKIQLAHDLDCSRRLQQLARHADVFVMVTASSKHAATGCIETHRPGDRPLLRPAGRGVASILRAVREHFSHS